MVQGDAVGGGLFLSLAKAIGMVDEVYPAAELEGKVREQALALTGHAPLTMAAIKEATRRMRDVFALDAAEDIILSCYLSEDFKEGARAFLERRTPNWQGR